MWEHKIILPDKAGDIVAIAQFFDGIAVATANGYLFVIKAEEMVEVKPQAFLSKEN